MGKRAFTLGSILLIGGLAAMPAAGQVRGDRGFGRRGGPREFTPEQRQEMYDRVAEHQLEHFTSDYELTAEQQDRVRARLEELKVAQRRYAERVEQEREELHRQLHEAWERHREDPRADDEERRDRLRDRMREMWNDSPLMNPEHAAEAIESLLPDEQVAKGRQRRAERRAEMERRMEAWRERGGGDGERDGRRRDREWGATSGRGDSWDRYVADFLRRYELDPSQQSTAESILRELKQERDAYRESQRESFNALRQIEDRQARWQAYEKLNEPIDRLYTKLKDRLMKIPTSAQIKAAESAAPTSRPADVTSRPAGATSRSFGDRSNRSRRQRSQRAE